MAAVCGFQFPEVRPQPLELLLKNAGFQAIELIRLMLQFDSARRPSAAKVLAHPFFLEDQELVCKPRMESKEKPAERFANQSGLSKALKFGLDFSDMMIGHTERKIKPEPSALAA